ncbi:hypothetical protein HDU86_008061, partial [Geranomyces michiganensis]
MSSPPPPQEQKAPGCLPLVEKPSAVKQPQQYEHDRQQHVPHAQQQQQQQRFHMVGAASPTSTAAAAEEELASVEETRVDLSPWRPSPWRPGPSSAPPRGINWPRFDPVRRAKFDIEAAAMGYYDLGVRQQQQQQPKCSHSRRVSWNADVAVADTYSPDEYDRHVIEVTPVTVADAAEMRSVKEKYEVATRRNSRYGGGSVGDGFVNCASTSSSTIWEQQQQCPRPQLPRTAEPPALCALGMLSDEDRLSKLYLPPPRGLHVLDHQHQHQHQNQHSGKS